MSLIQRVPANTRVRYPIVTFESDPLALGQYNFANAGNTDAVILENISPQKVYLIERVTTFGNVAESSWLEGLISSADTPRFHLRLADSVSSSIFAEPFRVGQYAEGLEQLIYFQAQTQTQLLASAFGVLQQSAGMVGNLTLLLQVSLVIYEVTDSEWVAAFETGRLWRDLPVGRGGM